MQLTEDEIYDKLKSILVTSFEIDEALITPEASLFEDLRLDSIDAVDLAVQVEALTGKRIQPTDFKEVRTVSDVINAIRHLAAP